ncbi:VanZ like protein [Mycolicibacterium mucogenicum 261Sha1.1M5]|nr:VanZ like protein [Mycolicibacterium mucogenicum 261Sha1.1M5]
MTGHRTESAGSRRRLSARQWTGVVGLGLVLLAALAITLNPTPVDRGRGDDIRAFLSVLHGIGVPESFGYLQLEFTANIIMFVPLGLCFALLGRGRKWWAAALVFPFVLSSGIELAQLVFLPERFADVSDIIANTVGGWIGVGLAALIPRRRNTADAQEPFRAT